MTVGDDMCGLCDRIGAIVGIDEWRDSLPRIINHIGVYTVAVVEGHIVHILVGYDGCSSIARDTALVDKINGIHTCLMFVYLEVRQRGLRFGFGIERDMTVGILRRSDITLVFLPVVEHGQGVRSLGQSLQTIMCIIDFVPYVVQSLRCRKCTGVGRQTASRRIEVDLKTSQREIRIAEMTSVPAVRTGDTQTDGLSYVVF